VLGAVAVHNRFAGAGGPAHHAQKLYNMASARPGDFAAVVQEFNDGQMLPLRVNSQPQPTMQQQQQIQPKKKEK
jgi:hypothetical protein